MNKRKLNRIIKSLRKSIPADRIITDRDILETYSHDETSDLSGMPDIVIRAKTVSDVSGIFKVCTAYRVPVIPRGAGTGVTGGAVPVHGGLVLSLEQMNSIIEIDEKNMVAVVEPGVITGQLQNAAREKGLMYPPDPASLDTCSLGGNVAEGAGGPRAVKYGTTKDYVLGLEFVLADGSIINTGGKIVKNATGYNLAGILTGSEGTLAVITKIYLRLIPAPACVMDLLIPFDNIDNALDTVTRLLQNRIIPAAVEFMEENTIRLVKKYLDKEMPCGDAGAHLLIQIDGDSEEELIKCLEKINSLVNSGDVITAGTPVQRERIWKARRSIREAIRKESPVFVAEDTVVPRSEIPGFIKEIKEYLNSINLFSVMFGHAGDGNVHIDVLKGEIPYDEWRKLLPELKKNIYRIAISHGGTLTGEHGIGYLRKDYLPLAVSKEGIELSKRIRAAFDPDMILNPGKIFKE